MREESSAQHQQQSTAMDGCISPHVISCSAFVQCNPIKARFSNDGSRKTARTAATGPLRALLMGMLVPTAEGLRDTIVQKVLLDVPMVPMISMVILALGWMCCVLTGNWQPPHGPPTARARSTSSSGSAEPLVPDSSSAAPGEQSSGTAVPPNGHDEANPLGGEDKAETYQQFRLAFARRRTAAGVDTVEDKKLIAEHGMHEGFDYHRAPFLAAKNMWGSNPIEFDGTHVSPAETHSSETGASSGGVQPHPPPPVPVAVGSDAGQETALREEALQHLSGSTEEAGARFQQAAQEMDAHLQHQTQVLTAEVESHLQQRYMPIQHADVQMQAQHQYLMMESQAIQDRERHREMEMQAYETSRLQELASRTRVPDEVPDMSGSNASTNERLFDAAQNRRAAFPSQGSHEAQGFLHSFEELSPTEQYQVRRNILRIEAERHSVKDASKISNE